MKVFFLLLALFFTQTNAQAYTLCAKEIKQAVVSAQKIPIQDVAIGVYRDGVFFAENQSEITQYNQDLIKKQEKLENLKKQYLDLARETRAVFTSVQVKEMKNKEEIDSLQDEIDENMEELEPLEDKRAAWEDFVRDPQYGSLAKTEISKLKISIEYKKKKEKEYLAEIRKLERASGVERDRERLLKLSIQIRDLQKEIHKLSNSGQIFIYKRQEESKVRGHFAQKKVLKEEVLQEIEKLGFFIKSAVSLSKEQRDQLILKRSNLIKSLESYGPLNSGALLGHIAPSFEGEGRVGLHISKMGYGDAIMNKNGSCQLEFLSEKKLGRGPISKYPGYIDKDGSK